MADTSHTLHADPEDNNRRIVDLEERLTFQQQALEQLDEVIRNQQLEMGRLRSELTRYSTELEQLSERIDEDGFPPEKPPHY